MWEERVVMNKMKKILLSIWAVAMAGLLVLTYFVSQHGIMKYMTVALCIAAVLGIDILCSKRPKKDAKPFVSDPVNERGLTQDLNLMASVLEASNARRPEANYTGLFLSANSKPRVYDPVENAIAQKIIWVILALAIIWFVLKAFRVV